MTYIPVPKPADDFSITQVISEAFAKMMAAIEAYDQRQRDREALRHMSDRLLADIGLTPASRDAMLAGSI